MAKEPEYFMELSEIAKYLKVDIATLLEDRAKGKFPINPRPRDGTLVYHRSDIDAWVAGGKPYSWITQDRTFVSRKPSEVQNG